MEDNDEGDTKAGWSEEVDRIEMAVLSYVADTELTTCLIRKLFNEFTYRKAQVIREYRSQEKSNGGINPEHSTDRGPNNPRKRRRHSDEDVSDEYIDEEDGDGNHPPKYPSSGPGGIPTIFSCPLFMGNPMLYCRGEISKFFIPCQRGFKTLKG